ncbi:hypothetical protein, partial [Snodgrassella sp. CFCC 13594]|uniref:hypothetical protein n=1 Tax=Snodgrassella sp. CFCC 13594 TaxID=1775559 RepID=UPI000A9CA1AD
GWALGVETGDTITGNGALTYMQAMAKQKGIALPQAQVDKIRYDMALAYLNTLAAKAASGSTNTDITYYEMRKFHKDVFEANDLDIGYWTLETPMALIERYAQGKRSDGSVI